MDFWKSALAKAESVAKRGMELAESTAEEAGRKLKDLGLADKLQERVGTSGPAQPAPNAEELEYFAITPDFQEFIRTLNYSTFRDFPAEHLVPLNQAEGAAAPSGEGGSAHQRLNPWQERHAKLVCQVVKEVNELRYVSCPRYMTDEHFWHVYFTLVRKYLPDKAFSWGEQDVLPFPAAAAEGGDVFTNIGSSLKQLSARLQQGGRALAGGGGPGVELSSLGSSSSGAAPVGSTAASSGAPATAVAAGVTSSATGTAAAAPAQEEAGALDHDPDLEAYLQVAIEKEGGSQEGEDLLQDDELDLDQYINELSAEVEAADSAEEKAD